MSLRVQVRLDRVKRLVELYKQVYEQNIEPHMAVNNAIELLICRLENELEEG